MTNKEIVINYVKNKIKSGEYKPGSKIMSEAMMIEYLGVTRYSIREALEELIKDDIIVKQKGAGSFIKEHKEKKYIVISVNEAIFINEVGSHCRNLTKFFQEKITEAGYISIVHLEPDSDRFTYGYTDPEDVSQTLKVPINKVAGLISINGNVDSYEILEKNNIPIIVINKSHGIKYPSVNIDYSYYYNNLNRMLIENNFKKVFIFHYVMHELNIEAENLIHYAMDRYFSDNYSFLDVPLSQKNNDITNSIEKHIKNIKKAPDCIVFLDNTLYMNFVPLFPKYNNILKDTKIITHSNSNEVFPQEYKICRLAYNIDDFVKTGMDLLLKLIKKECPIRTSYDIKCTIINEDMLK
ncbi:MAG: GntR family transcriptional regulator [Abditibacteriota bacterium]|nr:GntR family transcriptional regulator [Abditibacteriota bacterium]